MKPIIDNYVNKSYPEGSVTQWFGENPELYQQSVGLAYHNGIDIIAPWGTHIKGPCDMVVVEIKYDTNGYGSHVRAIGGGYELIFGHLSKIYDTTTLGKEIKCGEYFCNMGNTGFVVSGATPYWEYNPWKGTHCHFGIRKFTPRVGNGPYNIQYPTGLQGTIENYENGVKGAVDPRSLFKTEIIDEVEQKKQLMLTIIGLSNQVIGLLRSIINFKKQNYV